MELLHPFMPFVTEEIYHLLEERTDDLCVKQLSAVKKVNKEVLSNGNLLKNVISGIRDIRNKHQIKPKDAISLFIQTENKGVFQNIENILAKQLNAKSINFTDSAIEKSIPAVIGKEKYYIQTEQPLNTGNQKEDLLKELNHLKGFLLSVEKKLNNEKFVQNAKPEVLALEQKKKSDAETKIRVIEESLALIG